MTGTARRLAVACLAAVLGSACQSLPPPFAEASPIATAPAAASPAPSASAPTTLSSPLAFEVAPGDGKATIRIREQLIGWTAPDDAILTTDAVTGRVGLRDDGTLDPASSFAVELGSLQSDDFRRANAARETMNADRFPTAEFRPTRADGLPSPLPASGKWTFRLVGLLRVNGLERETVWDATAERSGETLRVGASTAFPFGTFGMTPPRRGPVLSLVDEIRLRIDASARRVSAASSCRATPQDVPANYKAGAPLRRTIGSGYVFGGLVRSSAGCAPIAAATVEIWHANANGSYDDDHRATLVSDAQGRYALTTILPPSYGGGRAHIHIRVTAPGHRPLVAIFFPDAGTRTGDMELVLDPF